MNNQVASAFPEKYMTVQVVHLSSLGLCNACISGLQLSLLRKIKMFVSIWGIFCVFLFNLHLQYLIENVEAFDCVH